LAGKLRLTSDFSHWVIKCERLLDTESERKLIDDEIGAAVVHVHARLGTPQMPQVEDVLGEEHASSRERFYSFWQRVWAHRKEGGDEFVTATLEYGPPETNAAGDYAGYTPYGSKVSHETLLSDALRALQHRFQLHTLRV